MKTSLRILPLVAVLLVASACGGPGADPLVGTYVLDVDRTLAASGDSAKPNDATLAAVRVDFAPAAYRFQVLADGTFLLTVGTGSEPFTMGGTWSRTESRVDLTTTAVNGQPLGEDAGPVSLPCRTDGDGIVLTADGRDLFLRRA